MIEVTIYNILGIAVLGNMIAHWYLPIQAGKRKFVELIPIMIISSALDKILNCSKCTSFILGFLLFQDLLAAALASFLGFLINHIIDRVEEWYQ